jgi:hypothetical protein
MVVLDQVGRQKNRQYSNVHAALWELCPRPAEEHDFVEVTRQQGGTPDGTKKAVKVEIAPGRACDMHWPGFSHAITDPSLCFCVERMARQNSNRPSRC